MSTPRLLLTVVLVGAISTLLGYMTYQWSHEPAPKPLASTDSHRPLNSLPDFNYPDLQDNMRNSSEWKGKVLVLNFWATWCPPCRKEMPVFIEAQKKYASQVQFVGIAVDNKEAVKEFAENFGINFPTLLADMQAMQLSKQLGNQFGGLPFTVFFSPDGQLKKFQAGEIHQKMLESELQKLL